MGNNGGTHRDPNSQPPSPYVATEGTLRIDKAQLPAAITLFKQAYDQVVDLLRESRRDIQMQPMAADRVSVRVAEVLNLKSMEGTDSALGASAAFRDQLQLIVDKLEATLAHYRRLEAANRAGFRGGTGV